MDTVYEQDYAQWAEETANKLENKRFSELDIEHLIEEIRDLKYICQEWIEKMYRIARLDTAKETNLDFP